MSRRRGSQSRRMWIVLLAVLVVGVFTAFPASSFTSANVERGATVSVVNDTNVNALVPLDMAPEISSNENKQTRLVTIHNGFNQELTVDVTGQPNSTLYLAGGQSGSSVTVTVASGDSTAVEVSVDKGAYSSGDTYSYTIRVTGGGVAGTMTRSATVTNGNPDTGGGGGTCPNEQSNENACN